MIRKLGRPNKIPTPAVIAPDRRTMKKIFRSGNEVISLYDAYAPTAMKPPLPRLSCPQYPTRMFKPIEAIAQIKNGRRIAFVQ